MSELKAELVRVTSSEVDIKVINGPDMHVLQWRRRLFWDEVLVNGQRAAHSTGLMGREKVYGLVFGRNEEGEGGMRVMLIVDPRNSDQWTGMGERISGVRLETADGPLIAYGSLDPRELEKPSTFSEWMKKQMGMQW